MASFLRRYGLLAAAGVALVVAGCLPAPGADNAFFVLVPYAAGVVGCGLAALQVAKGKPEGARPRAYVGAAGSALAAAGEVAFVALHGTGVPFGYGAGVGAAGVGTASAVAYVALAGSAAYCLWRYAREA